MQSESPDLLFLKQKYRLLEWQLAETQLTGRHTHKNDNREEESRSDRRD